MINKLVRAAIAAGSLSLVGLLAAPGAAQAAVTEHGRKCNPGSNGNACAVVREDGTYVRSRLGLDSYGNAYSICLSYVRLVHYDQASNRRVEDQTTGGSADCVRNARKDFYTYKTIPIDRQRSGYCTEGAYRVKTVDVPGDPGKLYTISSYCW